MLIVEIILSDVGPADIDVVAAIGDYLVAGTAALANNTGDTFKDFPEVSFAMGKFFFRLVTANIFFSIFRWFW